MQLSTVLALGGSKLLKQSSVLALRRLQNHRKPCIDAQNCATVVNNDRPDAGGPYHLNLHLANCVSKNYRRDAGPYP